ncbi:iron chelate uptake ABC transporter, FeCT family, permease protein [Fusobacterium necrophorum subsp. funduliforme ATCC 51357]|uniref:Iron ABC transporter permease n=1 Tax=Fusobacterium necrophorum subsp. funduliforme TaxID=143387 RepID=A0A162IKJ1_9FUSO|nr:iron ABC transporter permease [Fusobacterium necrophorum]AYV93610.1 iron ABC transporter permease [Fusobacterium necrophorum subsp. funduliforme]EIJ70383.1 iron chelate uptake ABC transporter, FeCT family, permease protein [Fusobacterium necrophorum subsp. funduliforme ATCC 51357]KAB0551972.1 iron ABC transporter permease [Fusobacterium necrophorum subsp. funduliforme]KYL01822.1 iron ABC transporter permease [Fusobacterium necrophorum subsp. funduliforme]KYM42576.1 iron ABC transporter perm
MQQGSQIYRKMIRKRMRILFFLFLILLFLILLNVSVGSSHISILEILEIIFRNEGRGNHVMIVKQVRMPMALMAVVVGASLGVGGCEIQSILRNPIASPYTLGITSAASFGAAMGLLLNSNVFFLPDTLAVTGNAFFFTVLVSLGIYVFSFQKRISKTAIILFGIALNFLFSSLTMILQYIAEEDKLQSLIFWTFGSLLKTTWNKFYFVFWVLLFTSIVLYRNAWKLTAMTLDDNKARSIGVPVQQLRRRTILIVSLLSAVSVSFVGTIGFVGLVAPHISRQFVGEDQRFFMPLSALLGAVILSCSFLLSKLIIPGVILPIGLVTSVIGIPFFIAIIFGKMRSL